MAKYLEETKFRVAALTTVCGRLEIDAEDEHLYHSQGWCREFWIQSLGMKAVLPPPEERRTGRPSAGVIAPISACPMVATDTTHPATD